MTCNNIGAPQTSWPPHPPLQTPSSKKSSPHPHPLINCIKCLNKVQQSECCVFSCHGFQFFQFMHILKHSRHDKRHHSKTCQVQLLHLYFFDCSAAFSNLQSGHAPAFGTLLQWTGLQSHWSACETNLAVSHSLSCSSFKISQVRSAVHSKVQNPWLQMLMSTMKLYSNLLLSVCLQFHPRRPFWTKIQQIIYLILIINRYFREQLI